MNVCLRFLASLMLLLLPLGTSLWAESFEPPVQTELYAEGQDGYAAFRIPAMVCTTKGTLLAFAEGRVSGQSDNGNIDTVLKRSTDGGKTWSKLSVVGDMGTDYFGNPCPVVDRTNGRIWLPLSWKAGENSTTQNKRGTGRGTMDLYLLYSDDDGVTWSKPQNINAQVKRVDWNWYVAGPGNGIQLASGRLMLPCNHRTSKDQNDKASYSHVIYSDDHGKTWQIGGACERKTNECQIAELANGDILMSIRSHENPDKLRAFTTSTDQGLTWSPVRFAQGIPDPTCQGSLIRLPESAGKNSLLFSNPASIRRERMTVRLSKDGGATWPLAGVLHEGPASYSSLVMLPDGRAACLYEKGAPKGKATASLVFATFSLDWLDETSP